MVQDKQSIIPAHRILIAFLVGVLTAGSSYYVSSLRGDIWDFAWPLNGARVLLAGENPYTRKDLGPSSLPPDVLLYPMPALVVAMPFTPLPDVYAAALFTGLSSMLLGHAVLKYAPHATPVFVSAPFWLCVVANQWGILIAALTVLPLGAAFVVVKPSFLLAALASQHSRRSALIGLIGAVLIALLTLPLLWTWPLDWLKNVPLAHFPRIIVLFTGPGMLTALALFYWRRPGFRLLLGLALNPALAVMYDHVALVLVPQSRKYCFILAVASWPLYLLGRMYEQRELAISLFYLLTGALAFATARCGRPDQSSAVPVRR